jgi:uncharacterized membrane protein (DUF485 family)
MINRPWQSAGGIAMVLLCRHKIGSDAEPQGGRMTDSQSGQNAHINPAAHAAILQDERYTRLVRLRGRFGWLLTAIMLLVYFGYILTIAFRKDLLARPIGEGVTSIGIPVGIGVILTGIVLTGIYVRLANRLFDPLVEAIRKEHGE